MKKTLLILSLVLAAVSCEKKAEFIERIEIGCADPSVEVSPAAGTHVFNVLCNGSWSASQISGKDWARLDGATEFSGDGAIKIDYDANTGDERKAVIRLTSGHRDLDLEIIQNNASETSFAFPQRNMLIDFEGGVFKAAFVSSVPEDEIRSEVVFEDGDAWIEEPLAGVKDGFLWFSATENMESARRGAVITLSATDKVGRDISASLFVSQKAFGEVSVIPVTVADVRNFTIDDLDGENRIRKNYVVTGRVINDNSQGNGGAIRNLSIITQDRTLPARTVYLQSLEPDGSGQYCGIQIIFKTEADNTTRRYDLLEINLKGLLFSSLGQPGTDDPQRIVLSDASGVNIISSSGGTEEDLPKINRKIGELTDSDIYTYVTLEPCEIPIRKGPFCPVDLRYQNIVNKYPMVVRASDGSMIYMISNVNCAWARDGKGMPEGAGPISGVIVHERCDNFEWDSASAMESTMLSDYYTDKGYIGKYQIRPVTREEIAIKDDLSEGITNLITEWRYYNALYPDNLVLTARNDTLFPSYPPVANPLDGKSVNGYIIYNQGNAQGKISTGQDWTHLGPVEGGVITDIPGTNGVNDALGRPIHWNPLSYCNLCGIIQGQNGTSWHGGYWYSGDHSNPKLDQYYWEIELSTEDFTSASAPLSVALGVSSAYGDDTGAPRYWTLAWSTDKVHWNPVYAPGKDYTYTIPDFPIISSQKQFNLPGNKYICINLPKSADVWGKEHLYIHLFPAKDISGYNGAAGGVSYDGTTIYNNRRSCLNYVGIRCQK